MTFEILTRDLAQLQEIFNKQDLEIKRLQAVEKEFKEFLDLVAKNNQALLDRFTSLLFKPTMNSDEVAQHFVDEFPSRKSSK